jgi:hypothetical protein
MEISNKTLALFLVAAVTISLFGTVISLNKMNRLVQLKSTTGYALSDTALAQVTVNTTTSIIFTTDSIDFGSGTVNTSGADKNCTLAVNATKSVDCIGFTHVNVPFVLENDGTTFVSVVLNSSKNASAFLGGTDTAGGPQFKWKVEAGEASSCLSAPVPAAYTDVNDTYPGTMICNNLTYVDTTDTLNVSILINIPYTTPQGAKTASLMATATEV